MVNGTDANDLPLNTPLIIVSPDAIAEFRLVTNTLNPEFGRNSGAILNAVTRGGTNAFHGSAFEFFRDTSLNARNFFGAPGQAVIFHQNQFGGTVGGPIKKDKAFFFFSYQGTRNRNPGGGGSVTVFSTAERGGIFPALATSTGTSPFPMVGEDGKTYPAGTPYAPPGCPKDPQTGKPSDCATLFPNGHIPTSNFNSVASGLMNKFVPLPNQGVNSFLFNAVNGTKAHQLMGRVDLARAAKDNIFVNWFWQTAPASAQLPFTGANLPGFDQVSTSHQHQWTASWTHILSDRMLNEARFGYTRLNFGAVFPQTPTLPSSAGFSGITPQNPGGAGLPLVTVSGLFTLGFSNNGPQPRIDQTYQVTDNISWTVGRHALKFGFDMRRFQVYNPFSANNNGNFTFAATGPYTTGLAGVDFLLGIPDSYLQGTGDVIDARAQQYYSYAQDQFRIRPNLTLTFGVGWQIDTALSDIYHENHATVAFRPGLQSRLFPTAPLGYVFQGDINNAAGSTAWKQFGPRFGFAWSPDWGWLSGGSGKMSIRAGYGIYFNRSEEEMTLQFLQSPPFGFGSGGIGDAAGNPQFANPWCDIKTGKCIGNKFPASTSPPFGSSVDFTQYEPLGISVLDPTFKSPYAQNWNLTLERQLRGDTILSVAYVGASAHRLVASYELNLGTNPTGCAANPTCVTNRGNQNLFFPNNFRYPGDIFGGIGMISSIGNSNYNALQLRVEKHFSKGLQFLAAYTWAHAIDNGSSFENTGFGTAQGFNVYNQAALRGDSAFDARHRFVFSYTYELPFRHMAGFSKLPSRLTEGWKITGITAFQSGFPINVYDGGLRGLICTNWNYYACPDRPNSLGSAQFADPRTSTFVNGVAGGTTSRDHYFFNPNTFAREAFGTYGNQGRNNFHGPGLNNFDFALFKDTKLTESTRIELRFEFFNFFNHTQFNTPTANINSTNFGRVTTARDPRFVQLAAKVYF